MPEMSGKQLADEVVALSPESKVLYVSGYTDHIIANRDVLDVEVAFLEKPFSALDLARRVRQVLDGELDACDQR